MGRMMKAASYTGLVFLFSMMVFTSVSASISISNEMTQERQAKPGETYSGTIQVQNTGDTEEFIKMYQTDYRYSADGSNDYGEPGKLQRSNANWITFSPKEATIAPKARAVVNYTVKVPDGMPLSGTYWSLIMVEQGTKIKPLKNVDPKKISVGLTTIMRYAIQINTNIGDTGTRMLRFVNPQAMAVKDGFALQVVVENPGERVLRPEMTAEFFNMKGEPAGKFVSKKTMVLPGMSILSKFDLKGVPQGKYKVLLVADCGGSDVYGAEYSLGLEPPTGKGAGQPGGSAIQDKAAGKAATKPADSAGGKDVSGK